MNIVNLWDETMQFLKDCEKTWSVVKFVVSTDGFPSYNLIRISKSDFERIAKAFDYDNDFGRVHVPLELKLVGEDWWIERREYDGAEDWTFKKMPDIPLKTTKVEKIEDGRLVMGGSSASK